jgi:xylan 1,4-beta-xylosidase
MTIAITADAGDPGSPLVHFWSACVGAGRANEGLRATWQEHLRTARAEAGFRYVRFHGLFHDDMFVYRAEQGHAVYNFQYVNDLFDRLLDAGVRPFVELGFCPRDLARETGTAFWWGAHGAPPTDLDRWVQLVERTVANFIDRYGIEEVRRWYFEVWNEPNLNPFFRGTRSEYLQLYAATARALKGLDPRLRVGGPATSNFVPDSRFAGETEEIGEDAPVGSGVDLDALDWRPVWLTEFLEFCRNERLPVDFVSSHPYPTDWALDTHGRTHRLVRGVDSTRTDLALLRALVDDGPFPDAEIHLTEWNSSPSSRDHTHDYLQAATFVVRANLESIGLVDSLSYWTFTDVFEEAGAGDTAFHGGFGMINYQGIVKPTFHAYRFLHQLGDERLAQLPGVVVTRDSRTGRLAVLAYHYPPQARSLLPSFDTPDVAEEVFALGEQESLEVRLTGLSPGSRVLVEVLDRDHGNAVGAWQRLGRPEPLNREHIARLRHAAWATGRSYREVPESGTIDLSMPLSPWSVVLIRDCGSS